MVDCLEGTCHRGLGHNRLSTTHQASIAITKIHQRLEAIDDWEKRVSSDMDYMRNAIVSLRANEKSNFVTEDDFYKELSEVKAEHARLIQEIDRLRSQLLNCTYDNAESTKPQIHKPNIPPSPRCARVHPKQVVPLQCPSRPQLIPGSALGQNSDTLMQYHFNIRGLQILFEQISSTVHGRSIARGIECVCCDGIVALVCFMSHVLTSFCREIWKAARRPD